MAETSSSPSFQPLYKQIKALITQSLISGEWRPGESIPSETELAGRFKVSQGTVRKAINELAEDNLLVRQQGKGTFVASHNEERRQFHFLRIHPDHGERAFPRSELLSCQRAKADGATARVLEVNAGATVVVVQRIQKVGEAPLMWEEIRVPASLFKGLSSARINEYGCKMYSLFESAYGVRIVQVAEEVKAVSASAALAEALGVEPGSPLLKVERVAYTFGDKPVEWRKSFCNTANYHYMNKIV